MELNYIIAQFLPDVNIQNITPLGNGLIHQTFLVETIGKSYVLQHINDSIFEKPEVLVSNHLKVNENLKLNNYKLALAEPIKTIDGQLVFEIEKQFWRVTEFINGSMTYQKVLSPEMAYNASEALSYFHYCINSGDKVQLEESIPGFTNFEKRFDDFSQGTKKNKPSNRLKNCLEELIFLQKYMHLGKLWIDLIHNGMPNKIIHADPKISNILFDSNQKAIAIIDLDTVLSGPILYDFGDMIRSFTNRLAEDDISTNDNFDPEIYHAVKEGFLKHSKDILTNLELEHLDYAAKIVVHVQALRFLLDYLKGDIYYDVSYEDQNLNRAKNQINLLKALIKMDV